MSEQHPFVPAIYDGWHTYQTALIEALRPLTADQLQLRAAPHLRTVGEIATHIVPTRAGWFFLDLGEQDEALAAILARPREDDVPARPTNWSPAWRRRGWLPCRRSCRGLDGRPVGRNHDHEGRCR